MSIELIFPSFSVIITTLTGLSWHLGCCIPHQVLAHLTSKQRRIHTLSLIIDGTCTNQEDYSGLCKFKKLRSITWKGMRLDENREVIRRFFQVNAQHLEYLDPEPVTFLSNDRLPIETLLTDAETATPGFGALRHLCLSRLSVETLLASTFQMGQLQSLKLRDCFKQLELLERLSRSKRAVNLRSFEIVHTDIVPHYDHTLVPIKHFLNSFTGIEKLCISLEEWYSTGENFLDSIHHHEKTLKRLMYHMRAKDENRRSRRLFGALGTRTRFSPRVYETGLCGILSEPTYFGRRSFLSVIWLPF